MFAEFDALGGASRGLLAWELFVDERAVSVAWQRAVAQGWLETAERDAVHDEQLYRLTPRGWAAVRRYRPDLAAGRTAGRRPR